MTKGDFFLLVFFFGGGDYLLFKSGIRVAGQQRNYAGSFWVSSSICLLLGMALPKCISGITIRIAKNSRQHSMFLLFLQISS